MYLVECIQFTVYQTNIMQKWETAKRLHVVYSTGSVKELKKLVMRRNPEATVRQSEGVSLARVMAMNITEVKSFLGLLGEVIKENKLLNQLGKIFNVDESGLQ
jgi:hypothetical protein